MEGDDAMSYGEAVAIVTMPHIPCIYEHVISVAQSSAASEGHELTRQDVSAIEDLVDAISDLQVRTVPNASSSNELDLVCVSITGDANALR